MPEDSFFFSITQKRTVYPEILSEYTAPGEIYVNLCLLYAF